MKFVACVFGVCLLWTGVAEAITISLSADLTNSSYADSGSVDALLTDGFVYNVFDPTSATPNLVLASDTGYEGDVPGGSNVVISFTLDNTYTVDALSTTLVVDVWGRSAGAWQTRDDDFDVILFDGNYSNVVASALNLGVPDGALPHTRATFDLGIGLTVDRFQIIGHDTSSSGAGNPFTLMEVRMGSPVPLTWTGSSDGNWSNSANWVGGVLPVDNGPGTGWDEGLSMPYNDVVVFAGSTMPTNLPGIGGNTAAKDSPSIRFNSGGTTDVSVVGREGSFWTNPKVTRDVLTVGDGVGGGTEDVTVNLSMGRYLQRHGDDATHNFVVHSDGTLSITSSATALSFRYPNSSNRLARFTINGGDVVIHDPLDGLQALAGNYIDFTAPGGSFTAQFGLGFNSITAVRSSLDVDFLNHTGGQYLRAVDNGDNSFTVSGGLRWTGAAGDQDWSNTTNWVRGMVPVDSAPGTNELEGLNLRYDDVIVFDGNNLPTNAPGLGGHSVSDADTPSMVFNSGGTIDLALVGSSNIWTQSGVATRTAFTVGDGIGGGDEDVVLNLTMADELKRYSSGHHNFMVNSDGTLNIFPSSRLKFSSSSSRTSSFTIHKGKVVIHESVTGLSDYAGSFVEFTADGGAFSAQYGGNFANIAAVESSLGTDFIDSTGRDGAVLEAIDEGSTFTVTVNYGPAGAVFLIR